MNPWLQHKTAGLPRWAWIALFSGAVMVGIYLRTQQQEKEYGPEEEPVEEPLEGLSEYEGTEQAGGLAAAGLVGPAAGQVVPVESPMIPQGIVDIVGAQQETIGTAIGALSERDPTERVETETIREVEPIGEGSNQGIAAVTGGGAPNKKPHHKPPKKPKQKKPPKQKQHKPKQNRQRKPKRQRRGKVAVGPGHRAR